MMRLVKVIVSILKQTRLCQDPYMEYEAGTRSAIYRATEVPVET